MGTVVVVIAHGSRAEAANEAHREAAAALDRRVAATVIPAFLELADPGIGAAIDAAVVSGADEVLVLPHFLYPGNHVVKDIPEIVEAARTRHGDVRITLLAPSGADPAMADLLATQVETAANPDR